MLADFETKESKVNKCLVGVIFVFCICMCVAVMIILNPYFMTRFFTGGAQSSLELLEQWYQIGLYNMYAIVGPGLFYCIVAVVLTVIASKDYKEYDDAWMETYGYKILNYMKYLSEMEEEPDEDFDFLAELAAIVPEEKIEQHNIRSNQVSREKAVAFCLFLVFFAVIAIFLKGTPMMDEMKKIRMDIEWIQNDRCESVEGYLTEYKKDNKRILSFISEPFEDCNNYKMIEGYGSNTKLIVPTCLNFTLDEKHLYDIGASARENRAKAAIYRYKRTPAFGLVVSIETLPPLEMEEEYLPFPESFQTKGYTRSKMDVNDTRWDYNATHAEFENGGILDFTWYGSYDLGRAMGEGQNSIFYTNHDISIEHRFHAMVGFDYFDGIVEGAKKEEKEHWIEQTQKLCPYNGGSYDTVETEHSFRVVMEVEDEKMHGKLLFLFDEDVERTGAFIYLETLDSYHPERVDKIINSISLVKDVPEDRPYF